MISFLLLKKLKNTLHTLLHYFIKYRITEVIQININMSVVLFNITTEIKNGIILPSQVSQYGLVEPLSPWCCDGGGESDEACFGQSSVSWASKQSQMSQYNLGATT